MYLVEFLAQLRELELIEVLIPIELDVLLLGHGGESRGALSAQNATCPLLRQMRKILIFGMVLSIGARAQQWLDPSFGDAGLSLTWLSQYFDGANRVAVQSDGKLVVMGPSSTNLGVVI